MNGNVLLGKEVFLDNKYTGTGTKTTLSKQLGFIVELTISAKFLTFVQHWQIKELQGKGEEQIAFRSLLKSLLPLDSGGAPPAPSANLKPWFPQYSSHYQSELGMWLCRHFESLMGSLLGFEASRKLEEVGIP